MVDLRKTGEKLWELLSLVVDHFHDKLTNGETLSGYEIDSLIKLLRLNGITIHNIHNSVNNTSTNTRSQLSSTLEDIQSGLLELPTFPIGSKDN